MYRSATARCLTGRWSCSSRHELARREIVEARMRPHFVVVPPPCFDDDLRLGARTEPFEAQALVAELAVEAFRDAILPRLAGLDQRRADALRDDPGQQCLGYELRPVVAAQERRDAACAHQAGQHLNDVGGANAAIDIDRQSFLGELIRDGQALELLAVGAMIEHEIVGRSWRPRPGWPAWAFGRHSHPTAAAPVGRKPSVS
jgi:hypothetical protein